jgi:hypothetical protein
MGSGQLEFPDCPDWPPIFGEGARPGIWIRPLDAGRLQVVAPALIARSRSSVRDVRQVAADISRLRQWGFDLVKLTTRPSTSSAGGAFRWAPR